MSRYTRVELAEQVLLQQPPALREAGHCPHCNCLGQRQGRASYRAQHGGARVHNEPEAHGGEFDRVQHRLLAADHEVDDVGNWGRLMFRPSCIQIVPVVESALRSACSKLHRLGRTEVGDSIPESGCPLLPQTRLRPFEETGAQRLRRKGPVWPAPQRADFLPQ